MSIKAHKKLFSSTNHLDQNSIICILEFLSRKELNNLASLFYHSSSEEIENEFYQQNLLNEKFGKCLMIYSWNDWFWKEQINEKIVEINSCMGEYEKFQPISLEINEQAEGKNYRRKFIKEIWKRIDLQHWKQLQQKRNERISYIRSIPNVIGEIAKLNVNYKNSKTANIISDRVNQHIFIEETSIKTPIQEKLRLETHHEYGSDTLKWVSMGSSGVGKTCLLMRVGYNRYPIDYIPTVFDGYAKSLQIPFVTDSGDEFSSTFQSALWDTAGGEEYDRLRPLSYPYTTLFSMEYAINDWSSLKYLVDHLMWECSYGAKSATFVVVSTKNDLRDVLYWSSLFNLTTSISSPQEEPISREEGLEFTKAIGAVSFIETSAKTGYGTIDMERRLALIRHTHLKIQSSGSNEKKDKKSCNVQ